MGRGVGTYDGMRAATLSLHTAGGTLILYQPTLPVGRRNVSCKELMNASSLFSFQHF